MYRYRVYHIERVLPSIPLHPHVFVLMILDEKSRHDPFDGLLVQFPAVRGTCETFFLSDRPSVRARITDRPSVALVRLWFFALAGGLFEYELPTGR